MPSAANAPARDGRIGLTVLVPCHNEERSVRQSVSGLLATLRAACPGDFEVVLVDDGSTDRTWPLAQSMAEQAPEIRLVRHLTNGGKGEALRTGFRHARGNVVCFLDCGLDLDPGHVTEFVQVLGGGSFQAVVGSKRHPETRLEYPWSRRALSWAYGIFVRTLVGLPLSDSQTGIKVFERDILEQALPLCSVKRYAFDAELLVLVSRLGYRIGELPIEADYSKEFSTGVNAREILRMFMDTLRVFYRLNVVHGYDLPEARENVGG